MKLINVAGIAAVALAVAASGAKVSAADLGSPYGGSLKDEGYVAAPMASGSGPCYVRGDVGYSIGRSPSMGWPVSDQTIDALGVSTFAYQGDTVTETSMANTAFGGVGLGCGTGPRGFRGEVMLGQTGNRAITGTPLNYVVTDNSGGTATANIVDPLHTSVKSTTLMFNAYRDLGQWGRVTPYVGAGVGVAYNKMGDVSFTGNPNLLNVIQGDSRLSLAWSLMAGVGYQLTDRATLDVGYRFMDYGKAQAGKVDSSGFSNNPIVRANDISAHEIKLGLRYQFGGAEAASYQPMK